MLIFDTNVLVCAADADSPFPMSPWTQKAAWGFLASLAAPPGFEVLLATPRHASVLARTLSELPDLHGNVMHDVHTAVLMREHGISRICTRDADLM